MKEKKKDSRKEGGREGRTKGGRRKEGCGGGEKGSLMGYSQNPESPKIISQYPGYNKNCSMSKERGNYDQFSRKKDYRDGVCEGLGVRINRLVAITITFKEKGKLTIVNENRRNASKEIEILKKWKF